MSSEHNGDNETELHVSKALGLGHSSVALWLRSGSSIRRLEKASLNRCLLPSQALMSSPVWCGFPNLVSNKVLTARLRGPAHSPNRKKISCKICSVLQELWK